MLFGIRLAHQQLRACTMANAKLREVQLLRHRPWDWKLLVTAALMLASASYSLSWGYCSLAAMLAVLTEAQYFKGIEGPFCAATMPYSTNAMPRASQRRPNHFGAIAEEKCCGPGAPILVVGMAKAPITDRSPYIYTVTKKKKETQRRRIRMGMKAIPVRWESRVRRRRKKRCGSRARGFPC